MSLVEARGRSRRGNATVPCRSRPLLLFGLSWRKFFLVQLALCLNGWFCCIYFIFSGNVLRMIFPFSSVCSTLNYKSINVFAKKKKKKAEARTGHNDRKLEQAMRHEQSKALQFLLHELSTNFSFVVVFRLLAYYLYVGMRF